MWTISLPLRVRVSKKKHFSLNLNQYRNTHFQTLNKAKTRFEQEIKHKLRGVPRLRACTLEYVVYAPSRQLFDTNNICSIVDKFFSDTLVACKVIPDDNYTVVVDSRFRPGGIDRINPRVDVIIRGPEDLVVPPERIVESEERNETAMKILLTAADVETAFKNYLSGKIVLQPGVSLRLELAANGEASIVIGEGPAPVPDVPVQAPKVRAAKSQPANQPAKPEQVQVAIPAGTTADQPPFPVLPGSEAAQVPEKIPETTPAPAPNMGKSLFGHLQKPVNPA